VDDLQPLTDAERKLLRLTSLARANIGELVLSDVVLDECTFAGHMASTSYESGQAVHSNKLHAGGDGDGDAWFAA
jgi:hypothetical protein